MKVGPQILFLDTENTPNIAAAWNIYEPHINYTDILHEWFLISGQWSWNDSKKINTVSVLDDAKRFKKNFRDDYYVALTLRDVISEADILVGHNIKGHDLKKINAKIIEHGIKPIRMPQVVDTLTWARQFGFVSKSLRNLCTKLELAKKLEHEKGAFLKAALGDEAAIRNIVKYGRGDIPTLRELYYRLRPYVATHPNNNLYRGDGIECCPTCGSTHFKEDGHRYTRVGKTKKYQCLDCGKYFSDGKSVKRVKMR